MAVKLGTVERCRATTKARVPRFLTKSTCAELIFCLVYFLFSVEIKVVINNFANESSSQNLLLITSFAHLVFGRRPVNEISIHVVLFDFFNGGGNSRSIACERLPAFFLCSQLDVDGSGHWPASPDRTDGRPTPSSALPDSTTSSSVSSVWHHTGGRGRCVNKG